MSRNTSFNRRGSRGAPVTRKVRPLERHPN
jgi:hypothetical protein